MAPPFLFAIMKNVCYNFHMLNKDPFAVVYAGRVKNETQEQYFRRAKRTQILCALVMIVWVVFFTVIGIVLT